MLLKTTNLLSTFFLKLFELFATFCTFLYLFLEVFGHLDFLDFFLDYFNNLDFFVHFCTFLGIFRRFWALLSFENFSRHLDLFSLFAFLYFFFFLLFWTFWMFLGFLGFLHIQTTLFQEKIIKLFSFAYTFNF